jgi:cell division protein FtsW
MNKFLSKHILGDKVIWGIVVFLSIISMLAVYSSIGDLAFRYADGNTTVYLRKHITFILIGFVFMYLIHKVPYSIFFSLSQIIIILAILLLVFTMLLGVTRNDATRWLIIPGLDFSFQTSDIAKFGLIVYIARILSLNQGNQEKLDASFKQIMIATGIVCALILPSNFSTAFLLFVASLVLMFIGRISLKKIAGGIGILVAGLAIAIVILSFIPSMARVETWKNRVSGFVQGDENALSQPNMAKTAIATSGLFGKGPGNSEVKYMLPQANSDFIFAIIIEEWGSIIAILIIAAYLVLLYRVGLIIKRTSRTFAAFLAVGITVLLVFQAFMNMIVAVGIGPVTGQPLPLISMGGTSLLITFASLGVVLSISRSLDADTPVEPETEEVTVIK